MKSNYPIVAREAWMVLLLFLMAAILLAMGFGWIYSLPIWLLVALLIFLFRDPEREIPSIPLAVVSPVDGTVLGVDTVADPFLDREAIRISMKMRSLGIFSIRSPMEGKIINRWFLLPGDPYPSSKEATHSLQITSWVQSDEGDDVLLVLGRGFRIPRCYVHAGERIGQGQRCGFVPLGAPIQVLVPAGSRVTLQPGDKLHAGSDVIAELVHRSQP